MFSIAAVSPASAQSDPAPTFLGAASCSSSSCHGGAGENRHQYTVWTKLDFHHERPFATLTTARSEQIARALKIDDPTKDASCTACHAPFQTVPAARLAPEVKVSNGVSCESCHGSAEHWIRSHTRPDYTYRDRVHAGLRDLKSLYVRANTCVACHQNVDRDLLQAGHPELIFELDGQSVTQPKHWREAKDWAGPQAWLVGQAVALREMSWQLTRENPPHTNAVHRLTGLLWLLQRLGTLDGNLPSPGGTSVTGDNAAQLQKWSDQLARAAAELKWSPELTRKSLSSLAAAHDAFADANVPREAHARRAERLVLALDRLVIAGPETLALRLDPHVNALFKEVQSLPDFDPAKFAEKLRAFQNSLKAD